MLNRTTSTLALLLTASTSIAQTLVVDSANGPGTDYTDLAVAAANAPDGAVLEVRPGFYFGPITVAAKSLAILCEPNAVIVGDQFGSALNVSGLTANQTFTLYGAKMQTTLQSFSFFAELRFANNAGPVLVEQLSTQTGNFRTRISASSCAQFLVRNSTFAGALFVESSRTTLEATTIVQNATLTAAATVVGGELQVCGGQLAGLSGFTTSAAVELQSGAQLRLLGNATLSGGGGPFGGSPTAAAVIGVGTVRIAPSVTLNTGPIPFGANVTVSTVAMPHVTTTSSPLGTPIDVTLDGQNGLIGLIVAGAPSTPLTAPVFGDAWWIDPIAGTPLMAGFTPFSSNVAIPANPALVGRRLVFQGLTWNATIFDASNPSGWIGR